MQTQRFEVPGCCTYDFFSPSKMSEENRNLSRRSVVLQVSRIRAEGSSRSLRCWLTYAEARSARLVKKAETAFSSIASGEKTKMVEHLADRLRDSKLFVCLCRDRRGLYPFVFISFISRKAEELEQNLSPNHMVCGNTRFFKSLTTTLDGLSDRPSLQHCWTQSPGTQFGVTASAGQRLCDVEIRDQACYHS
jgi:hypothetical protein